MATHSARACSVYCLGTLVLMILGACTAPAARFEREAAHHGYTTRIDGAGAFRHVLFYKGTARGDRPLTIYLDGDGDPSAGLAGHGNDPTSKERLILRLMAADPNAAVLVGRPCYYGTAADPGCDPTLWTSRRYAPEVVDAMAAVINRVLADSAHGSVTLVGYSGGGALALLVAPRLSRLDRVITLAANLDIAAWAAHHGQPAPAHSLNPARAPALAVGVQQRHFFGAEDREVPAATARAALVRQPTAELHVIAGYDHRCCWADRWDEILAGGVP